jgi:hypothetical protein
VWEHGVAVADNFGDHGFHFAAQGVGFDVAVLLVASEGVLKFADEPDPGVFAHEFGYVDGGEEGCGYRRANAQIGEFRMLEAVRTCRF